MTETNTKCVPLAFRLNYAVVFSKDRQAGSSAAALPTSAQWSDSAPQPFLAGLLSGHRRKLICHHNKKKLHSSAFTCLLGSSLLGHSVDASFLPSFFSLLVSSSFL